LTVFARPRSEKLWNRRIKAQLKLIVFVRRAAKTFGIDEQKQLKLTVFAQPRSENFCFW
jgi:hypothetical protein